MNTEFTLSEQAVGNQLKAQSHKPGARLKLARERANLSVENIAQKLHLTRDIVIAIEADQYEKLPGFTFARGYLRAYAHEVGVFADEIIAEFNSLGLEPQEPKAPQIKRVEKHFMISDRILPITTLIIMGILLLLVILWWHGQSRQNKVSPVISTMTTSNNAEDESQSDSNQIPLSIVTKEQAATNKPETAAPLTADDQSAAKVKAKVAEPVKPAAANQATANQEQHHLKSENKNKKHLASPFI